MEVQGQERGKPEVKKEEGRFLDNTRRAAEVLATLGAGAMAAWGANYLVDIPAALAIGAVALTTVGVGVTMAGLEVWVLAAYKKDSERRMKALFSQEPEKYVPPPADTDEIIRRAEQKRK